MLFDFTFCVIFLHEIALTGMETASPVI